MYQTAAAIKMTRMISHHQSAMPPASAAGGGVAGVTGAAGSVVVGAMAEEAASLNAAQAALRDIVNADLGDGAKREALYRCAAHRGGYPGEDLGAEQTGKPAVGNHQPKRPVGGVEQASRYRDALFLLGVEQRPIRLLLDHQRELPSQLHASCKLVFMPCAPTGLSMWAASPRRKQRRSRNRDALR
jgi:hypothetical protein